VLRDEGYLHSDRGGGSRAALPAAVPARPDSEPGERADVLDLTVAALPAPSQLLDAVDHAARALRPLLAGHGLHPLGVPELRDAVADHLSARGLPTHPEQILITGGALHGWNLVLRVFARRGDRVLVEQPTYPAVLDAVAAHGLRGVALPVSGSGWELPAASTGIVHVTPDAQNPTGLLASTAQRRDLLRAVKGAVIATDETFSDLVLEGPVPRPLGGFDGQVVTLGSMSKAFWAGLRIGWIRAETDRLARLAQARAGQDLASPVLDQLVAARLLRAAEDILPERRALLRRCRDRLAAALRSELPDWRFVVPRAGMVFWVELPEPSATRLAAHALDLGLRLTPGPRFTLDGTADRWLRLPFTVPEDQVEAVVAMLRDAATRAQAGGQSSRTPSRWTA
jgi:DNA-binding transcriptional MocR family regulator